MPWCPGCSSEYAEGKRKCSACGKSLKKSKEGGTVRFVKRNWAPIRAVGDAMQAILIKNFLEMKGFDVALRNGKGMTFAIKEDEIVSGSEIEILVPSRCASGAASLLRTGKWEEAEAHDFAESSVIDEDDDIREDLGFIDPNLRYGKYEDDEFSFMD